LDFVWALGLAMQQGVVGVADMLLGFVGRGFGC